MKEPTWITGIDSYLLGAHYVANYVPILAQTT